MIEVEANVSDSNETGFAPSEIFFNTTKPVGVYSRAADLSRARALLGWEPQTSFAEGLGRTVAWYAETRHRDDVASRLGLLLTER